MIFYALLGFALGFMAAVITLLILIKINNGVTFYVPEGRNEY
jgi:hypothetical protein